MMQNLRNQHPFIYACSVFDSIKLASYTFVFININVICLNYASEFWKSGRLPRERGAYSSKSIKRIKRTLFAYCLKWRYADVQVQSFHIMMNNSDFITINLSMKLSKMCADLSGSLQIRHSLSIQGCSVLTAQWSQLNFKRFAILLDNLPYSNVPRMQYDFIQARCILLCCTALDGIKRYLLTSKRIDTENFRDALAITSYAHEPARRIQLYKTKRQARTRVRRYVHTNELQL